MYNYKFQALQLWLRSEGGVVWFQRNEEDDTALGHYGFIAEEIHEIDPTFVVYEDKRKTLDSDGDYVYEDLPEQDWLPESVKYTDFIPLLVNLIKRQDARITALEAKQYYP